jgi:methionyl-tRNA formyltransferase
MKVVTFGFQTWGRKTLQAVIESGHEVVLAVTHPASEQSYKALWSDSVEDLAREHNIPVHVTERADNDLIERVKLAEPDVIVVNSWYTWLPRELWELPAHGTLNLHDSLLPKFSGFSPVLWALISGESEFGVTVHRMNEGLDTGDILVQRVIPIGPTATAPELVEAGMAVIPELLNDALGALEAGTAKWTPQNLADRTYFHKRADRDSLIDWQWPAEDLERFVRALSDPYPSAFSNYRGERIEIVQASISQGRYGGTPGRVIPEGERVVVVAGPDAFRGRNRGLVIERVRTADGVEQRAADVFSRVFSRGGYFTS